VSPVLGGKHIIIIIDTGPILFVFLRVARQCVNGLTSYKLQPSCCCVAVLVPTVLQITASSV